MLTNDENKELFERLWATGDASLQEQLVAGNMAWVVRLVEEMQGECTIPRADFIEAGKVWLTRAVRMFNKPQFEFAPNENLKGGYAIWGVWMGLAKHAASMGYRYTAISNEISLGLDSTDTTPEP